MRNAIFQMPESRTPNERRQVLRAAIRRLPDLTQRCSQGQFGQGLERAEIYLAAVAYTELDDRAAQRSVSHLRTDVESLRRHLSEQRSRASD